MSEKIDYVTCSKCGKRVSNKVGKELIIRAWVECVECLMGATGSERDLGVKGYKTFRWGNYIFNFPMKDEEMLIESAMRTTQPLDYIPPIPALRAGIVLKDEEGREWEVASAEIIVIPACKLKGTSRFEPPSGMYSPWGWTIFQYKIKPVGDRNGQTP